MRSFSDEPEDSVAVDPLEDIRTMKEEDIGNAPGKVVSILGATIEQTCQVQTNSQHPTQSYHELTCERYSEIWRVFSRFPAT